jgi:hypothetical protein
MRKRRLADTRLPCALVFLDLLERHPDCCPQARLRQATLVGLITGPYFAFRQGTGSALTDAQACRSASSLVNRTWASDHPSSYSNETPRSSQNDLKRSGERTAQSHASYGGPSVKINLESSPGEGEVPVSRSVAPIFSSVACRSVAR